MGTRIALEATGFTKKQDKEILEKKITIKELAKKYGKSFASVQSRRNQLLKIQADPYKVELKKKEIHILHLAVKGYSNERMAKHMRISIRTIETHKKNIMLKLSANNFVHAVGIAYKRKIL